MGFRNADPPGTSQDGVYGMRVLGYATSISIFVPGAIIYSLLGFFGAAAYGPTTSGNILTNKWGNKYVQVCLNLAIARKSPGR